MKKYFLIFLFGTLGGGCRLLLTQLGLFSGEFPFGTLLVNLIGCFIFPLVSGLMANKLSWSSITKTAVSVGFVGAFTTFSSFSFDSLTLIQNNISGALILYDTISLVGGLLSLILGLTISSYLSREKVPVK